MDTLFENVRYSQTGFNEYLGEAELNHSHIVFKAHFPEYPILPGVLILQFINMVMAKIMDQPLQLNDAANVKFVKPVIPEGNNQLKVELDYLDENKGYLVNAKIYFQDEVVAHVKNLYYTNAN